MYNIQLKVPFIIPSQMMKEKGKKNRNSATGATDSSVTTQTLK